MFSVAHQSREWVLSPPFRRVCLTPILTPLPLPHTQLTDFGLSGGMLSGPSGRTIRYCAPEVVIGGAGDASSDMYSYGLVAFQLMSKVRVCACLCLFVGVLPLCRPFLPLFNPPLPHITQTPLVVRNHQMQPFYFTRDVQGAREANMCVLPWDRPLRTILTVWGMLPCLSLVRTLLSSDARARTCVCVHARVLMWVVLS